MFVPKMVYTPPNMGQNFLMMKMMNPVHYLKRNMSAQKIGYVCGLIRHLGLISKLRA